MRYDNYYVLIIFGESWDTNGRLGARVGVTWDGSINLEIIGLRYVFEPKIPETLFSYIL